MAPSIFDQGMELLLVGMGTVFLLLAALVLAMSIMSRAVARYGPRSGEDDELAAAIVGALRFHRSRRN